MAPYFLSPNVMSPAAEPKQGRIGPRFFGSTPVDCPIVTKLFPFKFIKESVNCLHEQNHENKHDSDETSFDVSLHDIFFFTFLQF